MENAVEREGGLLCLNIYEGEEGIKGQWPTVSKAAKYKQKKDAVKPLMNWPGINQLNPHPPLTHQLQQHHIISYIYIFAHIYTAQNFTLEKWKDLTIKLTI